ncbi:MAG: glycosyltransferase family 4 protein [Tepidisphaerales bacterium]
MKILLVILHADPARGGAERYTVDLARGLAGLGHAVALAASSFGAPIESVEFLRLDAGGWSRLGRYRRFLESVRAHTRAHAYDIVHAMLPVEKCDLYHPHAGIAAEAVEAGHTKYRSQLGQTASRFFNRLNRKRRFFAEVERAMLMCTDGPRVICLSRYIQDAARRHYPIDEHRLPILLNGVDLARFDPQANAAARGALRGRLGLGAEQVAGLMIAQDFERKGLAEAIEAVAKVGDERLRLVVVGRPDPSAYRRLAERLGVAGRVVFAGSTDRPADFYRAADFFVLPTRHDPCSLVVLEALAMGLPVISTVCNGACEAMAGGTHGFVLGDPADVPALADAMRQLLDRSVRQSMRQACLDLRGSISQEQHVRRMVAIYEEIVRARQPH